MYDYEKYGIMNKIWHTIGGNDKRMTKIRKVKGSLLKRDMIRRYIISECRKLQIKLSADDISYLVTTILEYNIPQI